MRRRLKIADEERIRDLVKNSLKINKALTYEIDTCSCQLIGAQPAEGEEIIIEDDGERFFAGIIVKVELDKSFPQAKTRENIWRINCDDYTVLLDRKLVVEAYENKTADWIFRDIVTKYCPGFTVTGVQSNAPVVEATGTEMAYRRPSECFKWLCDYVGWHWQPDYYKDLQFFSADDLASPAPMTLTPGGKFRLGKHSLDTQGLRNRVYVQGGKMLSDPQVVQWKADGVARTWTLPWGPHEVSLKVADIAKSIGVENLHDEADYDYMMNFNEKYIRCSTQTTTPTAGATIELTAKQDIPVITMVDDYASQAAIKAVQGGDGIYEHSIEDDSLTTIQAAEAAGMADLREHANPRVRGSFDTEFVGSMTEVIKTVSPTFTRASVAYKQDGSQVASGVPRYETAAGVQGVMIEEGTTNLLTANQASIEMNTTGFFASLATIARVTTEHWHGAASLQVICSDIYNGVDMASVAVSDGYDYTLSAWVKGEEGKSVILTIASSPSDDFVKASLICTGNWQRISVSMFVPPGETSCYFYLQNGTAGAHTFYIDGLQLEQKPYATSWHLPGSARAAETLTVPTSALSPAEGAIDFVFVVDSKSQASSGPAWHMVFSVVDSNEANQIRFAKAQANNKWVAKMTDSAGAAWEKDTSLADGLHFGTITWKASGTLAALYIDGVEIGSTTSAKIPSTFAAAAGGVINLGKWISASNYLNSLISNFRISNRARTLEEHQADYNSGLPLSVDDATTYLMSCDGHLEAENLIRSYTHTWRPGQLVDINLPDRGIDGTYLIQRVTITPIAGIWTYNVQYGGRLLGIADFLQALVSSQQKKRYAEPAQSIQKFVYGEETLALADDLILTPRALPFVCGDADAICGLVVVSESLGASTTWDELRLMTWDELQIMTWENVKYG